jgi:hypothetical protein
MTVYQIDPDTRRLVAVFTQDDDAPLPPDCIRIPPPVELTNPRWNDVSESWESSTQFVPGENNGELP